MIAVTAPVAGPARIVGADDRASLASNLEAPLSGVGRLVCRDPATGDRFASTATLVGDRSTLLTTGHFSRVRTRGREAVIPLEYCAFELRSAEGGRTFGSLLAPGPVARFSPGAEPSPFTPDWAILKLMTPAPAAATPATVRPMKAEELAGRPDAFMVSYQSFPIETSRTKLHSPRCNPMPVRGAPLVFSHSCDSEAGSSGGLVFIATRSGPRAIGMNHGSAVERNYGQLISAEMLRNLPKSAVERRQGTNSAESGTRSVSK